MGIGVKLYVTLRKEHRRGVFEGRVLSRIFAPKWAEASEGWRKLQNEELRYLYSLPIIIGMFKSRKMRCAVHVARTGEKKNSYKLFVVKPEGKKPLGRPRIRLEADNKIYLGETGQSDVD
jgi:hypothetical protein